MTSAVKVQDVTVYYSGTAVLKDVSVIVPAQRMTAVVGPNGAGKSTLIKVILGLVKPIKGTIQLFGQPRPRNLTNLIAYIPQREVIDWDFPTDVLDVTMMGLYGRLGWFRRPGKKERRLAMEALEHVDMADFKDRQISELSGGQQQRVFLARSLVQDPRLYILDEPFTGIDIKTEQSIVEILRGLTESGRSVLIVHHDLNTLGSYFDHSILLNVTTIASGPTKKTFTRDNILRTYGGHVTIMPETAGGYLAVGTGDYV